MSEINKNKPGYKHTSLGWIPEEWTIESLSDLAIKVGSGITPTGGEKVYKKEGRYFLRSQNVGWGQLLLDDVAFIDENTHKTFPSTEIKKNDVLLNITGASIGRSAVVEDTVVGGNVNQHVCIIRVNGNIVPKYLNSYLISKKGQNLINSYQAGGNRQGLNFEQIKSFPIPIPTYVEQQKIAAILSTWDEAITKTQQLIAQLQQRNKGLMQQLLTGKKRLKGFEKSSNSFLPINLFAKEVSEKNKEDKELIVLSCTKYNGLVPSLEYFGRKIYSDDLTTYKIVSKKCFAYATNHIEEGSIGFQSEYEQALISPMYTVFKTDDSVNDEYLFKVLKSHHYIHEYQKRMEGSIDRRGGLRWDEFSKIKVLIPAIEEQKAIAEILNKAEGEVKLNQQRLSTLQQQKRGLMQKLLTGEVRVKI